MSSPPLNVARLEALFLEVAKEEMTGAVTFHFHKGQFRRWEKNRHGDPGDLPMPSVLTREHK